MLSSNCNSGTALWAGCCHVEDPCEMMSIQQYSAHCQDNVRTTVRGYFSPCIYLFLHLIRLSGYQLCRKCHKSWTYAMSLLVIFVVPITPYKFLSADMPCYLMSILWSVRMWGGLWGCGMPQSPCIPLNPAKHQQSVWRRRQRKQNSPCKKNKK